MTNIILGGSHRDVKKTHPKSNKTRKGPHYDSHHILAKKSYIGVLKKVSKGDGPAIRMRKRDHKRTASYGRGKRAKKFSAQQKKLLQKGKYSKAWMMEVKSSRRKFGKKYDKHYVQAEKQLLKLDKEKKIKLEPSFKKELRKRQVIAKKYGDNPRLYRKKLSENYDRALKKHPKKKKFIPTK